MIECSFPKVLKTEDYQGEYDARTFFMRDHNKCFGRSIQACDPTPELILKMFSENRLLAKMLVNTRAIKGNKVDYSRLIREIDDLESNNVVMASSTSLIVENTPCDLWASVGFLIDSNRANVILISEGLSQNCAVSVNKELTVWSAEKKSFINENTHEDVEYLGSFTAITTSKVNSLDDLTKYLEDRYLNNKDSCDINEVIIDYIKQSIIGVLVSKNGISMTSGDNNDEAQTLASQVKTMLMPLRGDLPIFQYDCSTGNLEVIAST